jgi:2-amino-4-hydroxy-6-hydroxymethyldihydropteridine diphosphokinase
MKLSWAYISIGSNMGDRLRNCRFGIETLCADGSVQLAAMSPFYETAPVDYTDQAWFVNAAAKIHTALPPTALWHKMQTVQAVAGRKSGGIRFGPRVLDLDIIFYEDRVMRTSELILPHPRMHKRRFVLQPICDIDPTVLHPVLGQQASHLLNRLPQQEQPMRPCSFDSSF